MEKKNTKYKTESNLSEPLEETNDLLNDNDEESNEENKNFNKFKKNLKKPGKTLLVKLFNNESLKDSDLNSLEGLENKSDQKENGIIFLIFDTVNNSLSALKKIKSLYPNCRIKFSYYKIFFTINGLTSESDYNINKKIIMDYVSSISMANVLYCKFYCKDNKYLGCGDLTIDTLEGLNKLISKDNGLKDYKLDDISGSFYRFNVKKNT